MSSVALASTGVGRSDQGNVLRHARKLYIASRFHAALVHFKTASTIDALLKCNCNRDLVIAAKGMGMDLKGIKIPTCHCKDLDALSTSPNPDKLAMYNLATKPCTCGSGMVPCKLPAHVAAVEGIVACYYKLEAPDKAYAYASLHVILAPEAPEGYLRMAKALRLMDTSQSPDTMARCTWIYHQAAESVLTYGNKAHEKLQVLSSLLRKDIIASLPPELRITVLKHLSHADVCRCMRVSKAWNEVSHDKSLWKNLKFVRQRSSLKCRPFRPHVLNNIITKLAGNAATSLTISSMRGFEIDTLKLRSILTALPRLESLFLRGSPTSTRTNKGPALTFTGVLCSVLQKASPGLRTLHLEDFYDPDEADDRCLVLEPAIVHTLQELVISNANMRSFFPCQDNIYNLAVWQKLEKLMIRGEHDGSSHCCLSRPLIGFSCLVTAMPALKDVSLFYCYIPLSDEIEGIEEDVSSFTTTSWDKLERFVLQDVDFEIFDDGGGAVVPRLPPGLRSLELDENSGCLFLIYKRIQDVYANSCGEHLHLALERLEHLRLSDYTFRIDGSHAHRVMNDTLTWFLDLLTPSVSNGKLTSLDIPFTSMFTNAFDQVLDKGAIRTLSCNDFDNGSNTSGLLSSQDEELLAWPYEFPNLTTFGVFPKSVEIGRRMIAKILAKESKIDTIYTNILNGVYWDDALQMAAKKGIRIIHADRVPEPVLKPLDAKTSPKTSSS